MTGQRLEAFGQAPLGAGLPDIGEPGLLRHPPAEAKKNGAFGDGDRLAGGKGPKAQGFQGRQGNHGAAAAQEVASLGHQ